MIIFVPGLILILIDAKPPFIVVGIAKIRHQTGAERCHARVKIRPDILT